MVMVKTEQQQQQQKKSSSSSSSLVPIITSSSSSSSMKKSTRKFKGVRMRSWGSWVSEIRAPNQKTRIWLGSYSTAEAAARAYDAALLCLRGTSSSDNLNFPVTSYLNIVPTPNDVNMSPKTIQRVAASAANNVSVSTPSPPSPSPSPLEEASSSSTTTTHSHYSPEELFFEDFNWCDNFDDLRYVDDGMFCGDDYLLPFDQTALVDYSYEESGDIRLWSFC